MKAVTDLPTGLRKNKLHNGFKIVSAYTVIVRHVFFSFYHTMCSKHWGYR